MTAGLPPPEPRSLADMERQHILATLSITGWNKSRAATILGIERSTLDRKIRRYELAEARTATTDDRRRCRAADSILHLCRLIGL